jgi:N-acylglucosamine-6-phosphate 2-epimerase
MEMSQSSSDNKKSAYLTKLPALLDRFHAGLIVSCQAEEGEPLHGRIFMAAMAFSAAKAGAVGIRANGPEDITAIRRFVNLPIIGIAKQDISGYDVRITPTLESAIELPASGADIIALDATNRPHPHGLNLADYIHLVHEETGCPVMADISTFDEGLAAEQAGADLVSTTLSGYTDYSPCQEAPDLELVRQLASSVKIPVIAEGRIATPDQAAEALALGAFAVTVGSAITRPQWITARFVQRMSHP